jgi:hypothetical protein
MLSITHLFLFVHIPKTAGNSLQNFLAPYSDDELTSYRPWQDGVERFELENKSYSTNKHSTLLEYRDVYPQELFERLLKFTVVRNTYERLISYYFSPHRGKVAWNRAAFLEFIKTINPIGSYISYSDQTLDRAIQNFDSILRFEKIESDFQTLCLKLGLPKPELRVRNKSEHRESRSYYDEELLETVYERFKDEIDFFRFSPP